MNEPIYKNIKDFISNKEKHPNVYCCINDDIFGLYDSKDDATLVEMSSSKAFAQILENFGILVESQ